MKIHRSEQIVTPRVRIMWPALTSPDKYSSYKVTVDLLKHPELQQILDDVGKQILSEAHEEFATKAMPTFPLYKDSEYKDQPQRLATFKMKAYYERDGKRIDQRPTVVDAKRQPCNVEVFNGSLCRIAFTIQYTITDTGICYMSPKLAMVQVLERVNRNGESSVEDTFEVEDGFDATEAADDEAVVAEAAPPQTTGSPVDPATITNGADFR